MNDNHPRETEAQRASRHWSNVAIAVIFFELATILALCIWIGLLDVRLQSHVPRLVGFDCYQASGPLYANEEDHFPPCGAIEEND